MYSLNRKTYKLKLLHNQIQYRNLVDTCIEFASAYNDAVLTAFDLQVRSKVELHHEVYYELKKDYHLNADYIAGAIAVAFETYKSQKKLQNSKSIPQSTFQSPRLTRHLYTLYLVSQQVSIATNNGRQIINFQCRKNIDLPEDFKFKSASLTWKKDQFYLNVVVEFETEIPDEVTNPLGVDLGVVTILATSDSNILHDPDLYLKDKYFTQLRKKLQSKGTRSSIRRMKSIGSRQSRLRIDLDHVISKSLVEYAVANQFDTIVMEDLTNIRKSMKGSADTNRKNHMWSYFRLQSFISYKARCSNLRVEKVSPVNTSIRCFHCGSIDKANRKSRDEFVCTACGACGYADFVAAINIKDKYLQKF